MLKIGYIGYGFVGKAQHSVFQHNSQSYIVDPAKNSNTINEMVWSFNPKFIFLCLPAPTLEDGSVDTTIIRDVLLELVRHNYEGVVVLKSTIPPEKIHDLYEEFASDTILKKEGPLRFIYSPEFLREAHAVDDALKPNMILVAGNWQDIQRLREIYTNHSHIKSVLNFEIVDHRTASLIKYAINSFLAMKVTFMNQMYQMLGDVHGGKITHVDWEEFTDIITNDFRIGRSHLQVPGPDGQYGYGGTCFPKDMKALLASDKQGRLTVLQEVEQANTKIRLIGKLPTDSK